MVTPEDWLQIDISAPAKFIISGEYSVVYGKQAIAATIDLATRVTIKPKNDHKVKLTLKSFNIRLEWDVKSFGNLSKLVSKPSSCLTFSESAVHSVSQLMHESHCCTHSLPGLDATNVNKLKADQQMSRDATIAFLLIYIALGDSFANSYRPAIELEIDSDISIGSGLGSSSAYSVSLCGGLMEVFKVRADTKTISQWAFEIDKYFHGKPSGLDNNVISHGGYLLFQQGEMRGTNVKHDIPTKVMIIDTGVSRSTKTLGQAVVARLTNEPAVVEHIFNRIDSLTTEIWKKLQRPDFLARHVSHELEQNHNLLVDLGVGHEKLNGIKTIALQYGLTAKLTGAGGGGHAFVYNDTDLEAIHDLETSLKLAGYMFHHHLVGCQGLATHVKRLAP